MTTSAFDGNDDARWRMTPDQERRSTMIYRLVVWSMPHPHHSQDIDDLRRWNHGVNDDNNQDDDHGRPLMTTADNADGTVTIRRQRACHNNRELSEAHDCNNGGDQQW